MTKARAFLLHLGLSAAAFAAALLIFVWLWYPLPYFVADGGWQGLRLLGAVDLVLGPLLTLVVYRQSKSRRQLRFDYACIGALQLGALLLGLWAVHGQRTELVVFADGRFYTIDAQTAGSLAPQARAILKGSPARPAYAAVRMPEDAAARQELRRETIRSGRPLYLRGDLLEPLGFATLERLAAEYPWSPAADGVTAPPALEALRGGDGRAAVLLPVACRYRNVVLAFERDTAAVLEWALLPVTVGRREVLVSAGAR